MAGQGPHADGLPQHPLFQCVLETLGVQGRWAWARRRGEDRDQDSTQPARVKEKAVFLPQLRRGQPVLTKHRSKPRGGFYEHQCLLNLPALGPGLKDKNQLLLLRRE